MSGSQDAPRRYVFINQQGAPAKSAETKHRVFVHVQRQRHRKPVQTVHQLSSSSGSDDDQACTSPATPGEISYPEPPSGDDLVVSFEALHAQHVPVDDALPFTADLDASISPHDMLQKGQSDPFDTYAISIDPITHQLITYYKNSVLFPRHHVSSKTWSLNRSAATDWQDTIQSLEDQGLAYAFLAQVSSFAAAETANAGLVHSSIDYTHRSTSILRRRLGSGEENLDSVRAFRHINLLQSAEITARNLLGTVTHGKMLRRLFDGKIERGESVNTRSLLYALYTDVLMAITFLVRPHFHPLKALFGALADLISDVRREVPTLSSISVEHLDPLMRKGKLHGIFVQWKQSRTIRAAAISNGPLETRVLCEGRRLWTCINQLETVNHLLDTEEELSHQEVSEKVTFLHAQAYMNLAALFVIRSSTVPEHLQAKAFSHAHHNLLRRLRHHLETSELLEMGNLYSHARLWALFVGAQYERQAAVLHQQPRDAASNSWFNVRFARQARHLGLMTWSSVRQVLEGFMYCEMVPHPSEWYYESSRDFQEENPPSHAD